MQNFHNFRRLKIQSPMSSHLRRRLEQPNKIPGGHKMIVVGGTGCVGERICKHATNRAYNVWSLSKNFPSSFPNFWTRMYHPPESEEGIPWPLFMTWRRFNVLQPYASLLTTAGLSGAKTMVHCVGQQRPTWFSMYSAEDYEKRKVHHALKRHQYNRDNQSPEAAFWDTNVRSVQCSLQLAKRLNVRNFIYISVSGVFPLWPFIFGDNFLQCKQKAEEILGGIHHCSDGTPMNIVILRPRFIYSERKPLTSALAILHSTLFFDSPVASNLTADRVARCVVNLSAELKEVTPKSTLGGRNRWNTPVRWIFEDEDIVKYVREIHN